MKIIYGNGDNLKFLQGKSVLEFIVRETVYSSGKIIITSWEAKIED